MSTLLGRYGNLAFYGNQHVAVVLDTELNLIVASGASVELLDYATWAEAGDPLSTAQERLSSRALDSLVEKTLIVAAGHRMYSIPEGVQREAQKALDWHKEHKRGGTPVGMNTARTLAKGGQIGIEKIRHIAKYFPRHEVDKKGKGWAPGEDNFPSNGRIAWALWGGDAAWRWASAIVERENKKAVSASGFELAAGSSKLDAFQDAFELDGDYGPEFMIRVNMDGSGIDRLYKIEADGDVCVWDDDQWDSLGNVYGDIYSIDAILDETIAASGEKTHVLIDPASAIYVAARLAVDPYNNVSISDIDAEEARFMSDGLADEDWELVDRVMLAGGVSTHVDVFEIQSSTANDGNYTPEERSQNASEQPRDATGRFVKLGGRTVVADDRKRGSGVVDRINQNTGKVVVRLDTGKTIEVDAKYLKPESEYDGPMQVPNTPAPLDLSGIVAEPRTPSNMPIAHLPGTLPPLTRSDINQMMNDWPAYVAKQRSSYKLQESKAYPGLKSYDKKFVKDRHGITAAADETTSEINAPSESDVTPKYLAFVSPDDPRAVMDLVALVPANKESTEPVLYSYKDGKWELDNQGLMDLKSATPPPVVQLDKAALDDVLSQLTDETKIKPVNASADSYFVKIMTAAGGLDRNRGNAEKLRRYWVHGEGAAKIRWGTPGDWKRCVKHLYKHMGPRAKGYCQLRHKDALGYYTSTHAKMDKKHG